LSQYTRLTDGQTDGWTDVDRKTVRMLRSRTVKTVNATHSLIYRIGRLARKRK